MEFQIGKKYSTRCGNTVECIGFDGKDPVFQWRFSDRRWRDPNGLYKETRDEAWYENDLDIVAAVEEPPVPAAEQGIALPGLPEGYLALRWDTPSIGDTFLNPLNSLPTLCKANGAVTCLILKKVAPPEPVCVWPKGVFKDGWLAQDSDGDVSWFPSKPQPGSRGWWAGSGDYCYTQCFVGEIKFRSDLDWKERIVKVGPEVENG